MLTHLCYLYLGTIVLDIDKLGDDAALTPRTWAHAVCLPFAVCRWSHCSGFHIKESSERTNSIRLKADPKSKLALPSALLDVSVLLGNTRDHCHIMNFVFSAQNPKQATRPYSRKACVHCRRRKQRCIRTEQSSDICAYCASRRLRCRFVCCPPSDICSKT